MKPVSPVVPGLEPYEITFGATQPQYVPLYALRSNKETGYKVMSRWMLTDEERKAIANGADIYLTQLTFGHEFQPSVVCVANAAEQAQLTEEIKQVFGLDDELNERLSNL